MEEVIVRPDVEFEIEMDTDPPLRFDTENLVLTRPFSFTTRCVTLPDLYAGKMHALIYRAWQNRVKGRDWYDFEWYVRHRVPLNLKHLQDRVREFNGEELTRESFLQKLRDKLSKADIELVKKDVLRFVFDSRESISATHLS